MKAVILSNGTVEDYDYAKAAVAGAQMIICADGGGEHAVKMGLIPDALIGDFDSISKETLNLLKEKGTKILEHPCEKDETDTQVAVEYAVENGAKELILIGGIGSRFDHTFANVSLLIWLMKRGIRGVIVNNSNEIHVIDKYIKILGNEGDKISLLPITPKVTGIVTKGLKYCLKDEELYFDKPRGTSNELTSSSAEIVIRDGVLLVIKAKE